MTTEQDAKWMRGWATYNSDVAGFIRLSEEIRASPIAYTRLEAQRETRSGPMVIAAEEAALTKAVEEDGDGHE